MTNTKKKFDISNFRAFLVAKGTTIQSHWKLIVFLNFRTNQNNRHKTFETEENNAANTQEKTINL